MLGFIFGAKKDYLVKNSLLGNEEEVVLSKKDSDEFFFDDHEASEMLRSNDQKSLIINRQKVNNYGKISQYFKEANEALPIDGIFAGKFQSHQQLRRSQKIHRIPVISSIYKFIDFGIHRVLPKMKYTGRLYFLITRGKRRRLTKTEVLGRLVRFGFSIEKVQERDNHFYFIAKKINSKITNDTPSFGLFYKMPRVGQNGKIIHVYKLRTMHPYSEYLQKYIYESHGTVDGDKIINDYRVSKWGRIMRKYWIDELPMILNLVKGDIKLVGIRPLSKHKFETYPPSLQQLRIKTKPGLFPPYYADLPKNKLAFFKSEEKYLRAYLKLGTRIDRKYLSLCLKNILLKMKRSA